MRGLTFELTGPLRKDARPGLAKMYRVPPDRAWRPAVAGPVVQRGVRPRRDDIAFALPLEYTLDLIEGCLRPEPDVVRMELQLDSAAPFLQ